METKEQELEQIFGQLKSLKEGMLGTYSSSPQELMEETAEQFEREYEQKKKAELLSREDAKICRSVMRKLEELVQQLKKNGITDGQAAFEWIRQWFDRQQDVQEEERDWAGAMLEHAFDFMEAAFGPGQELVIFISEMNADYYCVRFLQDYECERYYYYNKSLLVEDNSRAIEARLREL